MNDPLRIPNPISQKSKDGAREVVEWISSHPDELREVIEPIAKAKEKKEKKLRAKKRRAKAWKITERICVIIAALGGIVAIADLAIHLLVA